MFEPVPIDKNIKKQVWFRKMEWQHKILLMWLFLDMDQIGIVEPDMEEFFIRFDILSPRDIDLVDFVDDCNNDKKERMVFLDRGKKLWFNPTILFRNSTKAGFRHLVANERDTAILRKISNRETTRDWMLDQIVYNDRLEISKELVIKLHNDHKSNITHKEFANRIAQKVRIKIPKGKYSNEAIKERFGCQCQYCQEIFEKHDLEIDHVVPQKTQHKDVQKPWNKVPACIECNRLKSSTNVFVFLKKMDFKVSKGLELVLDKWVKRGVLEYPTGYGDTKRNIKEKMYTFQQMRDYVSNHPGLTTSDYELVNPEAPNDQKRWRRKNKSH